MYKLLIKRVLAPNVIEYVFDAPKIAKHAKPGQFIILRVDDDSERVPFTLCDMDKQSGTITLLVQTVGCSTARLAELNEGESVHDMVGPLGNATDLDKYKKICLVGGGIGTAVIFPQAKERKSRSLACDAVVGARNKELIMYEREMKAQCDNLYIMTDDGSYGEAGFVTNKLKQLMDAGADYDAVFAVGPMMMMKAVCDLTRNYGVHTIVSMNSIMVDGTGMCGGCRVTVDGEVKYACVDGPEFDGHKIDFTEALMRNGFYKEWERECYLRGVR